jgi:RNA polymerase sigma-70 factor (ECF subfamily)
VPDEPEVSGLLALMLLQHSRRAARMTLGGGLVTLEQQDRGLWNADEIAQGIALLEPALRSEEGGIYQLQAAIAACHAQAPTAAATDWRQIAALYRLLEACSPTPIVRLNRAIAIAMGGDLDTGLAMVEALSDDPRLKGYYLLDATQADLLRRRGDLGQATAAYERALALAPSEIERRYLTRRLDEVAAG